MRPLLGLLGCTATVTAAAQEPATGQTGREAALEEVVVTGSRIARTNLTSAAPVEILDSAALAETGLNNIAAVLYELPQVGLAGFSSTVGTFDAFNSGVNTVNLRNLGESRTLVLIDGRRAVSGVSGTTAVDLNTVPVDFIERVEVVTDGASAVYGSDAIAGVVNIILKDDFEGVAFNTRGGMSGESDSENYNFGVTIGGNFADDRGNAVVSLNYYRDEGLRASERGFAAQDQFLSAVGPSAFSTFPPQGRFLINLPTFAEQFTFDPDGNLVQGFDQSRDGFNRAPFRTISSPNDRLLIAAKANYRLTDSVEVFADASFAQVDTTIFQEPRAFFSGNVAFGPAGGIPLNNPFIPEGLRDFIEERNSNGDPGDDILSIEYARRLGEVGTRTFDNSRQTLSTALGFEGEFGDGWTWDAYYSFGQTLQAQAGAGQINSTNIVLALDIEPNPDVPGTFQCASSVARDQGCVPLNFFGIGAVTPEAAAFIEAPGSFRATIRQQVAAANIRGSLMELPAGPLGVAVGAEFREESARDLPDVLTQTGQTTGEQRSASFGEFDVAEAYVELDAPLLDGAPFAEYFGVNVAARFADYSTVGDAFSWKFGAVWQPTDSVRFRATVGTSVRAPNIGELFTVGAPGFGSSLADPCSGLGTPEFVDDTGGVLTANCLAESGIAQRIAEEGVFIQTVQNSQLASVTSSGNPDLIEEEADTLTVGVVLTPDFLPNLSVTVDYYEIDISDAIQSVSQETLLDLCYTTPPGAREQFCAAITRFPENAGGNVEFNTGHIQEISLGSLNVGEVNTSGIDVAVKYLFDLDSISGLPGALNFGLNYTRLLELEQLTVLPGSTTVEVLDGEIGRSHHRWNAMLQYLNGPLKATFSTRYIGSALDDNGRPADDDFNRAGDEMYHDIQVSYAFSDDLSAFVGINNITDNEPPNIPTGTDSANTGCNRPCGVYDPFGRMFQVGLSRRF